jgi:hypothetical protein
VRKERAASRRRRIRLAATSLFYPLGRRRRAVISGVKQQIAGTTRTLRISGSSLSQRVKQPAA